MARRYLDSHRSRSASSPPRQTYSRPRPSNTSFSPADCSPRGADSSTAPSRNPFGVVRRPEDVQKSEWNGILVLNAVQNGDFDLMPLRMDYLKRRFA